MEMKQDHNYSLTQVLIKHVLPFIKLLFIQLATYGASCLPLSAPAPGDIVHVMYRSWLPKAEYIEGNFKIHCLALDFKGHAAVNGGQ